MAGRISQIFVDYATNISYIYPIRMSDHLDLATHQDRLEGVSLCLIFPMIWLVSLSSDCKNAVLSDSPRTARSSSFRRALIGIARLYNDLPANVSSKSWLLASVGWGLADA